MDIGIISRKRHNSYEKLRHLGHFIGKLASKSVPMRYVRGEIHEYICSPSLVPNQYMDHLVFRAEWRDLWSAAKRKAIVEEISVPVS